MKKRLRVGVAALGIAFVLAIVLGATGVLTPRDQRTALGASTTLAIISGDVQVRHGANGDFVAADDGIVLAPGDAVRTGTNARAVLTYFEGSTVEIEPASELAIEVAHGNPDGSTVIEMRQQLGTTWHVVTKLVQSGSKYEVRTTTSTASVRGTQFAVGVAEDLSTTVATTEGNVATTDAASTTTVEVTQGLTTTTKKGEAPTPPQPAPEPERKVTVTIADPNALVVDSLGRANGIKDGKKIVQTPGAQVKIVEGQLVVTMPNLPDGDVATHFEDRNKSDDVTVTTKVEDKGKKAVQVTETVKPSETAVTGVEVKKSSATTGAGGSTTTDEPTIKVKKPAEVKPVKVGEIPKTPTADEQQRAAEINNEQDTSGKTNDVTGMTTSTDQKDNNSTTTTRNSSGATVNVNAGDQTSNTSSDAGAKAKEGQKQDEERLKAEEEAKKKAEQALNGFNLGPIVPNVNSTRTSQGSGSQDSGSHEKPTLEKPAPEKPAPEKPRFAPNPRDFIPAEVDGNGDRRGD